jgi:L-threonylcarbamoyladenylate synthase
MMARRLTISSPDLSTEDRAAIDDAARVLAGGGLVALPTETVYGLGANALDAYAVERIFAAKGRPFADPLIVHLAAASELPLIADVPEDRLEAVAALTGAFWPGPLTLILPKQARVPDRVTAGRPTVAVRVPAHPVARALIAAAGVPVAAPSANRFSRPSPTTAAHVAEDLGERVDVILDAGPTSHGVESTVVDLTVDPPVVLRPGAITLEALRAVWPRIVAADLAVDASAAHRAPGTSLKHYAPAAEVRVWSGGDESARAAIRRDAEALLAKGRRVGALLGEPDAAVLAGLDIVLQSLGPSHDDAVAASRLYDGLRVLDRQGVDVIIARDPGTHGLARTIRDRLFRAAEGRMLDSRNG